MQTSRGKNLHPDSPEDLLHKYYYEYLLDLGLKDDEIDFIARTIATKLDEYYTNKFLAQRSVVLPEKVDRFEVIDNGGRAYVKGSIYGSPVTVDLSYQDDGKTLKVFVTELNPNSKEADMINSHDYGGGDDSASSN